METLLRHCLGRQAYTIRDIERIRPKKPGPLPSFHLLVREERPLDKVEVTTGIAFVATNSAVSAAGALRRLTNLEQAPTHLLLVTDDERQPLNLAKTGREYYDELMRTTTFTFQHVKLTFEQYAELDALCAVIGMARSGELEVDFGGRIHAVDEAKVIDTLHLQDRYCSHVLLRELLTEGPPLPPRPPPPPPPEKIGQFIMAQLSLTMGTTSFALANKYVHNNPDHLELAACKSIVEKIAMELHDEGKLNATPHDDGLYLLKKW